ncbi:hypothetical protein C359_01601 [Cryptococcus neoformans Bt120]|nr:hypothetical protein C359_01601 [Cryptococcus neoformans var. grubii Bt120]
MIIIDWECTCASLKRRYVELVVLSILRAEVWFLVWFLV